MKRGDTGKGDCRGACRRKFLGLPPALLLAALGLRCGDESGGDALSRACSALDARLRECGALTGGRYTLCADEAWLAPELGGREEWACQYACYTNAECDVAVNSFCALLIGGSESQLPGLSECFSDCARQYGLQCAAPDGGLQAVPSFALCDGRDDCSDGSDEVDCLSIECGDGQVVTRSVLCDGVADCNNGLDERAQCISFYFTCDDGGMLPVQAQCDGQVDCSDGSDERGCGQGQGQGPMLDCTPLGPS